MNSLAGKVAGVNINASSSGVGGATRVVMRGTKSISSDNNALYVIDGVPIFNTNKGDTNGQYSANREERAYLISIRKILKACLY